MLDTRGNGHQRPNFHPGEVIETNAVGVSFESRQQIIALMLPDEQLWLKREPLNPFDTNAIGVFRQSGRKVGYINRELAAELADIFDRYGWPIAARVLAITGGTAGFPTLGVNIVFRVPTLTESGEANSPHIQHRFPTPADLYLWLRSFNRQPICR